MSHLDGVTGDELREALADTTEKTPALRLVAAIAYRNGVAQTELAEWFGVERKTVYNWLDRIDGGDSIREAVTDDPRTGRPRKLAPRQQARLEADLSGSPAALGYDRAEWTAPLLREHVEGTYDTTYSLSSCRRLLDEFGD